MQINTLNIRHALIVRLKRIFWIFLLIISCILVKGEDTTQIALSLQEAVNLTMKNSLFLKNAELYVKQSESQMKSSVDIGPTDFNFRNGQLYGNETSRYYEINQNFGSILKHVQCKKRARINSQLQSLSLNLTELQVRAEAKSAYIFWQHKYMISAINFDENELYQQLTSIAEVKYKTGEISLLKKAMLFTKASEVNSQYLMSTDELIIAENKLKQIMVSEGNYFPAILEPEMYTIDRSAEIASYNGSAFVNYYSTRKLLADKEIDIKKTVYYLEIKAGAFTQNIDNTGGLYGWQIGIAVPLWFTKHNADIRQAQIASEIAMNEYEQHKQAIVFETDNLLFELNKYFRQIRHYEETALNEANILINTATTQFETDEIEYSEYLESISAAYHIKRAYYEALHNYNQTAIQLEIYAE